MHKHENEKKSNNSSELASTNRSDLMECEDTRRRMILIIV